MSKYRPEIDGLRAFAVLSVVIFHAFPNWLKGGFIGVDIFFVISGYLISQIIFLEINNHTFSFADFFKRRIRRIFPALILVMGTSLVLGWFFLIAEEFAQLGKHIASGATFIINFVLVGESGYFESEAETKPMLHLWSLAVEEQFYIIWPLVIWFCWKRNSNFLWPICTLALVSFSLNISFVLDRPIETFFWPVGRLWELLCGAFLAWVSVYKNDHLTKFKDHFGGPWSKPVCLGGGTFSWVPVIRNLMSIAGLIILIYGVVRINGNLAFPGIWALIPIIGALLVIGAGGDAWLSRVLLMNPVSVWFGLISYPLYLWHWPALSFIQAYEGVDPRYGFRIFAVLMSILLAWLTYKFIEKPVRKSENKTFKLPTILLSTLLSIGMIGYVIFKNDGFDQRETKIGFTHEKIQNFTRINHGLHVSCAPDEGFSDPRCSNSETPNVFLWGDSFAMHLADALLQSPSRVQFRQQTLSMCAPIKDFAVLGQKYSIRRAKKCVIHNTEVLDWLQSNAEIEYVVLASTFAFPNDVYMDGEKEIIDPKQYLERLRITIHELTKMGKKPVIVSPPPSSGADIGRCWKYAFPRDSVARCDFSQSLSSRKTDELLRGIQNAAPIIHLRDFVCSNTEKCKSTINGMPLYRDKGHFSIVGSGELGKQVDLGGLVLRIADDFYNK